MANFERLTTLPLDETTGLEVRISHVVLAEVESAGLRAPFELAVAESAAIARDKWRELGQREPQVVDFPLGAAQRRFSIRAADDGTLILRSIAIR